MSHAVSYRDPDIPELAGAFSADVQAILTKFLPGQLILDSGNEGYNTLSKECGPLNEYRMVPPTDEPTSVTEGVFGIAALIPEDERRPQGLAYFGLGEVFLQTVTVVINEKGRRTVETERRITIGAQAADPTLADSELVLVNRSSGKTKSILLPDGTERESITKTSENVPPILPLRSLDELAGLYNRMRVAIITGVELEARQLWMQQVPK